MERKSKKVTKLSRKVSSEGNHKSTSEGQTSDRFKEFLDHLSSQKGTLPDPKMMKMMSDIDPKVMADFFEQANKRLVDLQQQKRAKYLEKFFPDVVKLSMEYKLLVAVRQLKLKLASNNLAQSKKAVSKTPPSTLLADIILPRKDAEAVIDSLETLYERRFAVKYPRCGKVMFQIEVIKAAFSTRFAAIAKFLLKWRKSAAKK